MTAISGLKTLLAALGVDRVVAAALGGCGSLLMFHRICPRRADFLFDLNQRNIVAPEKFCRLVDKLRALKMDIVDLDEAHRRLTAGSERRFVCLTFDDGYIDNHDILLPIAEERGLPITVYISTGLIDGTAALWWYGLDIAIARAESIELPLHEVAKFQTQTIAQKIAAFRAGVKFFLEADQEGAGRLVSALSDRHGIDFRSLAAAEMMDWAKVRKLSASRWVSIGAHTVTHPPLSRRSDAVVREEMAESRRRLERELGKPVTHFAYPFGTPDTVGDREIRLAAELGFKTAVVTDAGNLFKSHSVNVHTWPRHGIGPSDGDTSLQFKLAGASRNALRLSKSRSIGV